MRKSGETSGTNHGFVSQSSEPSPPTDISAMSVPRLSQSIVPARDIGTPRAHMITSAVSTWFIATKVSRRALRREGSSAGMIRRAEAKDGAGRHRTEEEVRELKAWMYQR